MNKAFNKAIEKFKKFFKKFYEISAKPQMRMLPGNLAFFLILSFAPILTIVAIFTSEFSIPLAGFLDDFKSVIPNDIYSLLQVFLSSEVMSAKSMIVYLIIGFIAASNGAHSIIITSNSLYEIKDDTFLARRIKAIFLTLVLILLFIFILLILVFGNTILKSVLAIEIFSGVADKIYGMFLLLKWPVSLLVIFILIKLLYVMSPDKNVGSKNVTLGAVFTSLGWIIVTAIYAYYANNLANYSILYGSLSNLIVLMIWIYIISFIFVMGISINVTHYGNKN